MGVSVRHESDVERRARLQRMWGSVAGGWGERADEIEGIGRLMTDRLLELADPRPGNRVLELACGPGGAGLEAARRLGGRGEVVLSDISPEMVAIAGRRARALELVNVAARPLDLEQIDEPDASYDVVLCREGLMFCSDPARAAAEIRRVLRPGGRLALSVWASAEHNPWLAILMRAASEELGRPLPPPGVPGPFSLGDAARLEAVLAAGGLVDLLVGDLAVPRRSQSFDAWWERTTALAGPFAHVLASAPGEAVERIRERARRELSPYTTPDGLELPGLTLIASARRGMAAAPASQ